MSRIDEMVQRLCPDGVGYKQLGEVANVQRGVRVVRKNLSDNEGYPVYQNSLTPLGYFTETNEPAGTPFVIGAGAAGDIGYSDEDYWGADDCYSIECSDALSGRFVYHVLLDKQPKLKALVRKASIPRLARTGIERLEIPVPSLDIQREIVRVLDSFAELEAKLEVELEAELEARKAQYAYYRDRLLSRESLEEMAGGEVAFETIGSLFTTFTGKTPRKSDKDMFGGQYPFYKPGDFEHGHSVSHTAESLSERGFESSKRVLADSTLVTCIASLGKVGYAQHDGACNQQINVILPNEKMNPRFVFLCCCSGWFQSELERLANHSNVPNLSLRAFNKIGFPIPPLSVQQRVVDILDRFDALTTSLTDGLPAEIEARRQQYEYYRDKLLDLPRKEVA